MLPKQQVKYIQSLSQKKFRSQEGVFIAEGPKIVAELLQSRRIEPVAVYATDSWWQQAVAGRLAAAQQVHITESELQRISLLPAPNQVLGLFHQPRFPARESFAGSWSLVLDGIQDPGNMGTIIRTADWFGISRIVAGEDSADVFNPKVVQSTMGSIARVQVLYEDLPVFLKQHAGVPVYAGALQGEPLAGFIHPEPGFVLIGNESKGIQPQLLALAARRLTIPRIGEAESLNAAVATGIILAQLCAVN